MKYEFFFIMPFWGQTEVIPADIEIAVEIVNNKIKLSHKKEK